MSEKKTLFEEALLQNELVYHLTRLTTPRHGKVERSHREYQKRFYDKATFIHWKILHLSLRNIKPIVQPDLYVILFNTGKV